MSGTAQGDKDMRNKINICPQRAVSLAKQCFSNFNAHSDYQGTCFEMQLSIQFVGLGSKSQFSSKALEAVGP